LTTPLAEADERLLIQAAQKDPRRSADLYESHFERIYSYVARRVHDRAATEDLTADVFHQALNNLPGSSCAAPRRAGALLNPRHAREPLARSWNGTTRE